jgi:NADPH:quinone reductase-like Zn-dependent oxidoreductase
MGLVGGGAHAEMVVVHEDETMPIPSTLSFIEAAAIPEAFLTAYDALFARGRLAAQERVLLHAVGSGVGTAAVQLAKRHGATVIGTSRTSAKLAEALALGVDQGVDTSAAAFRSLIAPVDVIIDVLGGPAFLDNLALLKPKGRLVLLGFLQGPKVAEMTLEPILRQRLEVVGTVMRTRPLEERIPLVHQFAQRILPQFNPGFRDGVGVHGDTPLRPIVAVSYPMSEIAEAHRAMEHNTVFGKIVLTWP